MKKSLSTVLLLLMYFLANAQITTIVGKGVAGYSGDGGQATAAKIQGVCLCIDGVGNIYFSQWQDNVIRKVNTAGVITTIAGGDTVGGTRGYSGDNGPATDAKFREPSGVAVDNAGNLYIADATNRVIRKIDASGIITTIAGGASGLPVDGAPATSTSIGAPFYLALDLAGNLFFTTNNSSICKINTSGIFTTIAGKSYIAGNTGDGGPATAASLNLPQGLCVDATGNVFIADYQNNKVRKINTSGVISTFAGTGEAGYSGDYGPATEALLDSPTSVAIDALGGVLISDFKHVIRRVDPSGIIKTVAGTGIPGYAGDDGSPLTAKLYYPQQVTVSNSGDIFFSDNGSTVIRRIIGTYLDVKSVSSNITDLVLMPNPNKGAFAINGSLIGNSQGEKVLIEVINVLGQAVFKDQLTPYNGNIHADIRLNNCKSGIYFLRTKIYGYTNCVRFEIVD